ncbi:MULTISPECIES: M24 family metallopeptidase [Leuconostoc]|uniref:Aminopeptidase YpdF (MP-, MA-, MS-, AP-, NP-specific) n=1 Tax=Leuconostoc inhae TaxID=178001 RepID=A0AAN2QV10_9LACO|nr:MULTISPECIES: aminopeptidase P family protein [Leuconostoc]MBR2276505.1 aminopeptidase P family protein [Leuconostoc sp.]MBZ5944659.1 aminopeptidase P family protein [Leuconostoc gasicomitatum]MBZ5945408.1 aminopeptidase P family protein [Leuconostoc gasicomitatum]MBZ5948052.1 aminopeptidase P family protein [Leuconostoc gasicomitatum]MBZ5949449.1 aminopeptidase P family protein [Leuconostoc gasicomitatum]
MTKYFEARIVKLQKLLKQLNLDGMIVYQGANMKYLTGFSGGTGDGVVIIGRDSACLVTDARYEEAYKASLPESVNLKITRAYYEEAVSVAVSFDIKKLAFEADMPYNIYDYIDELLPADISFDALPFAIEALREVKDEEELTALRKAAAVSVAAFKELIPFIKPGMTERQVANELDRLQKKFGAEKASFDTIVASGYRAALPHGEATDKIIEKGELVTIDFGYYVDDYTSDVTRTIAIGSISDELKQIYAIVKQANENAIAIVKPGISGSEVDRVARDYISAHGYGHDYNHSTGHGVGLDIHEGPALSSQSSDELQPGHLLTIEPGIYLSEKGGVRIEDDIIVTLDGYENLTHDLTKDLIVIED